ncbi:MAG: GNAT family N-acetyltransferase [Alphaproteobacteria bacterium]|nr:GNAT family N-acetyltransferase [Alphaproteobacteria bacterium]
MPRPRSRDVPIRIRRAAAADAAALHAMMRALAGHVGSKGLLTTPAALARDCAGPRARFTALLAEHAGTPVGYVSFARGYSIWRGRNRLWLDDLYVAARWRSRGVGLLLMRAVARIAARAGADVKWEVGGDNARAIAFYKRLGASVTVKGLCRWPADAAAAAATASAVRSRRS